MQTSQTLTVANEPGAVTVKAGSRTHRSTDLITGPLGLIAQGCSSLVVREPVRFEAGGQSLELPRYVFLGPKGGSEPVRIGIFAGIHGDEPAAAFALVRFIRLLENYPELARGYCLFLYPLCNPGGFADDTRNNRNGKDLNREFWRNTDEPEVRLLEAELREHALQGIVSLHTDDTSDGIYGYAHGPVIAENLLRPALDAGAAFLPRNDAGVIDGFRAKEGVIRAGYEGVLRSPPGVRPRPFEIVLETPQHAPNYLQEASLAVALHSILEEYRKFIAYAQNI